MELSSKRFDSKTTVFTLNGSLLSDTEGQQLLSACETAMAEGFHNIIMDMTALKHVNSSGLGIFIRMLTRTRTNGGDVVITGISPGVSNLFTITKLHTIFRFAPSIKEASELLK